MVECADITAAGLRIRDELRAVAERGDVELLLRRGLDIAERLTGSKIGFFHFVDEDQEALTLQAWSSNTLRNMCRTDARGRHYPITQAGVWVDCFRARTPVVHNNFAAVQYRKGLPPGHAAVIRELTVPLLRDGRVAAIAGVGNKPTNYTAADVESFRELAGLVLDLVPDCRHRAAQPVSPEGAQ
jgi:GAF domain-containing protein